ncbi:MAG TPA: hypothetical protein VH092_08005 [Urbifossiella sp.]|jgi:hypothetical protein|nr:hypothetical protein [Urbifossiella sp.]
MSPDPTEPNPPEWDDPVRFTEEELRQMEANGLTLTDAIRAIEAEFGSE